MVSSNDEIVPGSVANYYFLDERDSVISFAVLPLCRSDAKNLSSVTNKQVFLCGTAGDGSKEVYKQVVSWRMTSQDEQPKVWVLSKEGKWIKLSKPRNSYKERFRTLMVTLQWLHCLKREPEVSEKALWRHLHKVFSSFVVRPSKDDLTEHVSLIKMFADIHKTLANSQLLSLCLKENVGKRSTSSGIAETESYEEKPTIGHANDVTVDVKDADDDDPESFDLVCAICDNGGEIICCDGSCRRSFHASKGSGRKVGCESLGYSTGQVKAMQKFYCKNCQYNHHQCFACGKLGSSDKTAEPEVFPCDFASCGHFYHPKCVAKLLFQENEVEAKKFQRKIAAGDSFICPYHKCTVCDQGENTKIYELQFAICRRCPKSYHRKCLPRKISFKDCGPGIFQRAWNGLLHNRILIYCLKHEIEEDLQAPRRNHIIFPKIPEKNDKWNLPKVPENNGKWNLPKILVKDDKWNLNEIPEKNKKKITVRKRKFPVDIGMEGIPVEPSKLIVMLPHAVDSECNGQTDSIDVSQSDHFAKKVKVSEESKPSDYCDFPSTDQTTVSVPQVIATIAGEECNNLFPEIDSESIGRLGKEGIPVEPSKLIEKLLHAVDSEYNGQTDNIDMPQSYQFAKEVKVSEVSKPSDDRDFPSTDKTTDSVPEVTTTIADEERNSLFPEIDSESTDRIKFLMCELLSLINSKDVNRKSREESSHAFSVKHTDASIKHGKVEGSFEATLTACKKQENGELKEEKLVLCINYSTDEVVKGKGKG